jgi:hypothetical protein
MNGFWLITLIVVNQEEMQVRKSRWTERFLFKMAIFLLKTIRATNAASWSIQGFFLLSTGFTPFLISQYEENVV